MFSFDKLTPVAALVIDLTTLSLCAVVALRIARSIMHPAVLFLFWHFYIVTVRLGQLSMGFRPMGYFSWPVTLVEVLRGGFASDVGLIALTAGWVVANRFKPGKRKPGTTTLLSSSRLRFTAILAIVLGLVGLATTGRSVQTSQFDFGDMSSSGYLLVTRGWAPWGMCLLHYVYGFPLPLTLATSAVLAGVMVFSYSRSVVIIPILFLVFTWLRRRGKTKLPGAVVLAAMLMWCAWLCMKPFFYEVGDGVPVAEAFQDSVDKVFVNFGEDQGSGIDFQFLDMIGSTMTLADLHGQWYWGTTIAPVFVGPIPRALWPDKPYINQYQLDLDVPGRNMGHVAMTAGLVGEAYVNGGWLGICFTCFLLSFLYSAAYHRFLDVPLHSPSALMYLLLAASSMQVYRDGLVSIIWFPFVYMAPAGWVTLAHWISRPYRHRQGRTSRRAAGLAEPQNGKQSVQDWAREWRARQRQSAFGRGHREIQDMG